MGLETPGWRRLDFKGNTLSEDEVEQKREKFQKGPSVVRDREHAFTEDLIVDEAGLTDPNLPLVTKVTSPVQVLQSGGSYGFLEKLWSQLLLTAGNIIVEVAWNREEVLVSSVVVSVSFGIFPGLHL